MRRVLLCLLPLGLLACNGGEVRPEGQGGEGAVSSALEPGPGLCQAVAATLQAEAGGAVPDDLVRRRVALLHGRVAEAAGTSGRTLAVLDSSLLYLRGLPGGHDQVSRGLLTALAGLEPREGRACLVALLARQCGLAAERAPEQAGALACRAAGVAALPSSVRPLLEGGDETGELAGQVGPLLRALRATRPHPDLREQADRTALRVLEELGLPREGLARAWAVLEEVAARDPERAAPLVRSHGAPGLLRAEAEAFLAALSPPAAASPTREREDEPLDLTELRGHALEQARLDAAELLVRRGQGSEAQRLLEGASGPRAATLRGEALLAAGKPLEGERSLRAALVLNPEATPARLALARLYLVQRRTPAAQAELEEAAARMPLHPGLLFLLAAASEGSRERALLRAVLELDEPDGSWAAAAAARLQELERAPAQPPPLTPARLRIIGGG